jgi:hypothetical protein
MAGFAAECSEVALGSLLHIEGRHPPFGAFRQSQPADASDALWAARSKVVVWA